MKAQINLITKNVLLIKNYIIVIVLASILIPVYIGNSAGNYYGGILPLLFQVTFTIYFTFNQLSATENKYSGERFLSVISYSRKQQVISQYIFVLLEFIILVGLYSFLSSLGVVKGIHLSLQIISTVLSIITIMYSIFIPLLFLLGYDRAKYIPAISTFVIPYLIVVIFKFFSKHREMLDTFKQLWKNYGILILMVIASVGVIISIRISNSIFNNKDL